VENKRHLIIVAGTVKMGGAERVLTYLANDTFRRGHSVSVLTFDSPEVRSYYPLEERIAHVRLGAPRHPIDARFVRSFIYAAQQIMCLRRALKRELVAHPRSGLVSICAYYNALALLASFALPLKKIVTDHNFPAYDSWFLRVLRPMLYSLADIIVVLTNSTKDYFPTRLQKKIVVIPNPAVNLSAALPAVSVKADRPFVLGAGRLLAHKRFDLLVSAFGRIAGDFPRWDLKIAGDGPERAALLRQVQAAGLMERVQFLGAVTSMGEVYGSAELFVLCSDHEGFPMVLCEAMASGLAVIATDCPSGPSDIIRSGVDGLLVEKNNAAALADAMRSLMSNPQRRAELARNATSVRVRFSERRFYSEWESALDRLDSGD
jgi:glycosyltransferase involved in cell wall biosynthesis